MITVFNKISNAISRRTIIKHFERHIGKVSNVIDYNFFGLQHIDIHIIPSNEDRNFCLMFTTGMSNFPMFVPPCTEEYEYVEDYEYAELMILLPAGWATSTEKLSKNITNLLPIIWLSVCARLPHKNDTWFKCGDTIPIKYPVKPYTDFTSFCCMMMVSPAHMGDFDVLSRIKVHHKKVVNVLCLVPLYEDEMKYRLENGAAALLEKFNEQQISFILDMSRENVCK